MSLIFRIASGEDVDRMLDFAREQFAKNNSGSDSAEIEISSWSQPWRKESIEYYVRIGTSFVAEKNDKVCGFFLAQPLAFVNGKTQVLWVEFFSYDSLQTLGELYEFTYKLGRDKHFQTVLFPEEGVANSEVVKAKATHWQPHLMEVKTTRAL